MSKAKSYEKRIERLKRIIRDKDTRCKRLEHKLNVVITERDALKGLVNQ